MVNTKVILLSLALVAFAFANTVQHDGLKDMASLRRHVLLQNGNHINTLEHPNFYEQSHPSRKFSTLSLDERLAHDSVHGFFVHVHQNLASTQSSENSKVFAQIEEITGSKLTKYIAHQTYVVHTTHAKVHALSQHPDLTDHVLWIGYVEPQHKISKDMTDSVGDRPKQLVVDLGGFHTSSESASDAMDSWIQSASVDCTAKYVKATRAVFNCETEEDLNTLAESLSHEEEVHFVSRQYKYVPLNRHARQVMFTGTGTALPDYTNNMGNYAFDFNLLGESEVVSVSDTGVEYRSCFFADTNVAQPPLPPFSDWVNNPNGNQLDASFDLSRRKIVQYVTFADNLDFNGHGTHVSGSAVGSPANGNPRLSEWSGMASRAKLAFFDIGINNGLTLPEDLELGMLVYNFAAGARIHSASWGAETPFYISSSEDFDSFSYNNKNFISLVAAGNSGQLIDGFFTVGAPATAKNILSVGATLNSELYWENFNIDGYEQNEQGQMSMAFFSSNGPTADLRLKPDISAPGFQTESAANGQPAPMCSGDAMSVEEGTFVLSGTSMATPTLSGTVATIRQYFTEGYYPTGAPVPADAFEPSASLLRAVVINSAEEMTGVKGGVVNGVLEGFDLLPRPYYHQGYGRANPASVLYFNDYPETASLPLAILSYSETADPSDFSDRSIGGGETQEYCLNVLSDSEVRITLTWTDPPSNQQAEINLVNDLNLRATYQGQTYLGNLNGTSAYTDLQLNEEDPGDHRNNVEGIYFLGDTSVSDTELRVFVDGYAVNVGGSQAYSLVVSGGAVPCGTNVEVPGEGNGAFSVSVQPLLMLVLLIASFLAFVN